MHMGAEEHKVREIMSREQMSVEAAAKHVKAINRKRANHDKDYTNGTWEAAGNDHLCVDTGAMDADSIVKIVQMWIEHH